MMTAVEKTVRIVNKKGLHARAAAKFVSMASGYSAKVEVTKDGQTVGGCSIMGLLMLAAGKNSSINIRAEGGDAEKALAALAGLAENGFGEE